MLETGTEMYMRRWRKNNLHIKAKRISLEAVARAPGAREISDDHCEIQPASENSNWCNYTEHVPSFPHNVLLKTKG